MKIRIGTRKSRLAVIQTELVKAKIEAAFPEAEVEIVKLSTKGDELLNQSLTSFGGKGVFCLLYTSDAADDANRV